MEKKIYKWLNDGLFDEQAAQKMLDEIKEDREKTARTKINITIYTIAVVLIGLGIITFISANDWLLELLENNDLLKIFLMMMITYCSFRGGYCLAYEKKTYPKLGNALMFLSTLLIGGTYALIGQIYNTNANTSTIFFIWLISILPVAYLFKSRAINVLSIILLVTGILLFYLDLAIDDGLVWTIYMPIFCGIILYSAGNIPIVLNKFNDFSLSYKIIGILPIFITFLILTCTAEDSYHISSAYYTVPIVLLLIFNTANYMLQKKCTTLLKIETVSIITVLCLLIMLLTLPSVNINFVMILANILISAMIAFGFYYGYKFEIEKIINTTNWMLTIYLLVNYCRWGWSFMDKTVFFMFGGISLLSLGLFLEKQKREVFKKGN